MKITKKHFTTVTPFSKMVALSLFITLPMITFVLGIYHAEVYVFLMKILPLK